MREEAGMTQTGLAEVAGVDRVTVNRIEHGRISPTIETLEKLARALDVEVADFFPKAQAPLPLNFEPSAGLGRSSELKQPSEGVPDLVEALRTDLKLAFEILLRSEVSFSELVALLEADGTASETTRNDDSSRPGEGRIPMWMAALEGWETGEVAEELAQVIDISERCTQKNQKVVALSEEHRSA